MLGVLNKSSVMVDLCANLTGLEDARIAGKSSFLIMSLRVFPEEIRIWIGEVNKTEGLPQLGEALSNPLSVIIQKKGEGRWNLLSA